MNRREFLTGGGLALATGCVAPRTKEMIRCDEWSLAPGPVLNFSCRDLAEPLNVWVIGDSHLALHDERDDAHADFYARMARCPGDPQAFVKTLEKAKKANADLVLLVGDIISFPTLANVEFIRKSLDESGVRWAYVAGNHDWHFEGTPGTDEAQRALWISKRLSSLYPKGADPLCYSCVVKGVRFVMIDDSDYLITPSQLAFWQAEVEKGDPTVLVMHIPIWTKGWRESATLGHPSWGAAIDRYWQIERRQRWPEKATPETFAFVESVRRTPNLLGVLTGHIHSLMAARDSGQNFFSVPASRSGDHLRVLFRPL